MLSQFRQDRKQNNSQTSLHMMTPVQSRVTRANSSSFGFSPLSQDDAQQRISALTGQPHPTSQPNKTGIPNAIKQEFEHRSGLSFDDVRVHYHSDKPAQFDALAYTQGNQVYVGPGQERHLRHELGHVIQQKRGLVRPDYFQNGVPVSIASALEHQANLLPTRSSAHSVFRLPVVQFAWHTRAGHTREERELAKKIAGKDGKDWNRLTPREKRNYYRQVDLAVEEQQNAYDPNKSRREQYMTPTPSKDSPTGKAVIQHMLNLPNGINGTTLIQNGDDYTLITIYNGELIQRSLKNHAAEIDMGHLYAAVTFWNAIGRYTGKQSSCIKCFMMDDNNYQLQYGPQNSSFRPRETYDPPAEYPIESFRYIPCHSYGDTSNFAEMRHDIWMMYAQKLSQISQENDKYLCELVNKLGTKWKLIAQYFPGETETSVKNRYKIIGRKKPKATAPSQPPNVVPDLSLPISVLLPPPNPSPAPTANPFSDLLSFPAFT